MKALNDFSDFRYIFGLYLAIYARRIRSNTSFQEIREMGTNLDKQLRPVMQRHTHINCILLGSQESTMTGVFDNKKSPFYHFGEKMRLGKLPGADWCFESQTKYYEEDFICRICAAGHRRLYNKQQQ